MSAIAAVVDRRERDGRPADASWIWPLVDAAPHRGALSDAACRDGAALGVQRRDHRVSTADGAGVARLGTLCIAFHGRLDNGGELRARLADRRGSGVLGGAAADALLVLRAYERWGERCAAALVGDFAFVLWDGGRRRVFAARDALGVKPLYYALSATRLVAATELTQVLAAGVPMALNEGLVAEYLAFDIRSRTETLYRDVFRLAPGHWMRVTEGDVCIERYWAPDPERELHAGSDGEYADQFREVFGAAVASRAPENRTSAAYLSGGLDSSSVVCTLRALGRPVESFSLLFPGVPDADEAPFIDAVVRRSGVPSVRLEAETLDAARYLRDAARRADVPDLPMDAMGTPLLRAMEARGLSVALTGAGGDYGFGGSLRHYADFLQARDLRGLARQWRDDRRTDDAGWSPWSVCTDGLRVLLPDPLRRALRPMARRLGWGASTPAWMAASFVERTGLLARLSAPQEAPSGGAPTRRHVCALFDAGWTARLLETGERSAAEHGVDLRHPFFDRRLVEFAIALPERQRWRGRTTKFVMREALREVLPETVYARTGKADASVFVARTVEALGGERAVSHLQVEALGWVKPGAVAALYRRSRAEFARGDDRFCEGMFSVWMTLAIDAWYRAMFVEGTAHGRVTDGRHRRQDGADRARVPAGEEAVSGAGAR